MWMQTECADEEEEEHECLTGRDHQAHIVLQRLFHHRVGSIRPANGDVDEPIERDVNLMQAVRAMGKQRGLAVWHNCV